MPRVVTESTAASRLRIEIASGSLCRVSNVAASKLAVGWPASADASSLAAAIRSPWSISADASAAETPPSRSAALVMRSRTRASPCARRPRRWRMCLSRSLASAPYSRSCHARRCIPAGGRGSARGPVWLLDCALTHTARVGARHHGIMRRAALGPCPRAPPALNCGRRASHVCCVSRRGA